MDEEYYDEEMDDARVTQDQVIDEVETKKELEFKIDIAYTVNNHVRAAVDKLVTAQVSKTIEKLVDDKFKEQVEAQVAAAVAKIVREGMETKIKTFDYKGDVTSEQSFKSVLTEELAKLSKEGLSHKMMKVDSYGRSSGGEPISAIIQKDVYTFVSSALKPKFKELEDNFKQETTKVLRKFTLDAVDAANAKVLRGF